MNDSMPPNLLRTTNERVSQARVDKVASYINRINNGVFPPSATTFPVNDPATSLFFQRFQVFQIFANYLICYPYDAAGNVDDSTTVTVARPYLLSSLAAWNGLTFVYSTAQARVATKVSDATTEDQEVIPAYFPTDDIWGLKVAVGGTGAVDDGDNDVLWLDINADARQWAESD